MKNFMLGIGVLLGFSFAALAGDVSKTVSLPQGSYEPTGVSLCDADPFNLVSNCGFETSTPCPVSLAGCPNNFLPEWTPSGDLTYFGPTNQAPFPHSGLIGAFAGQLNDLGCITQTLPTTAGASYTVTFWLASGVPPNRFQAKWEGVVIFELVNSASFAYMPVTLPGNVASANGSDLSFCFFQPPDFWAFDDVDVTPE
jgi:hypothetical protein